MQRIQLSSYGCLSISISLLLLFPLLLFAQQTQETFQKYQSGSEERQLLDEGDLLELEAQVPYTEEEQLLLPSDIFIKDRIRAQPHPDSQLKDVNIKIFTFSNGEQTWQYVGKVRSHTSQARPSGVWFDIDYEKGTYFARQLTSEELRLEKCVDQKAAKGQTTESCYLPERLEKEKHKIRNQMKISPARKDP